jgi:hypothetical protein
MAHAPVTPVTELKVHARNYHAFMLLVKWFGIHLAALMTFLTLWFCTAAGFFTALVAGVLVLAAGIVAMQRVLGHSSEDETMLRVT